MGKTYFTSDTHFGHTEMIEYTMRPFSSVEQMNIALMRNINERVKVDDTLFILGDFAFKGLGKNYHDQINCKNVVFVVGNHDWNNGVKSKITGVLIHAGGRDIWLAHDPKDTQPDFELNLCGHVHKLWKGFEMNGAFLVNVGVDVWNYRPVELNEVLSYFDKFKKNAKKDEV